MSNLFKEYVTSSAFNLSLSHRQISVLLAEKGYGPKDERLNMAPYQALKRRGLIAWNDDGVYVTDAGDFVANLLVLAGFGSYEFNKQVANKKEEVI